MKKEKLEELKKEARTAGECDTSTEDYLLQSFQLWADEQEGEWSKEEHEELAEAYRLGFFGERLPQPVIDSLIKTSAEISWDNWEVEEVDGKSNSVSTGKYWKVSEVLHCRLEWLREELVGVGSESEHADTIDMLQELLSTLKNFEPNDF